MSALGKMRRSERAIANLRVFDEMETNASWNKRSTVNACLVVCTAMHRRYQMEIHDWSHRQHQKMKVRVGGECRLRDHGSTAEGRALKLLLGRHRGRHRRQHRRNFSDDRAHVARSIGFHAVEDDSRFIKPVLSRMTLVCKQNARWRPLFKLTVREMTQKVPTAPT